jgi:hypothetical protein
MKHRFLIYSMSHTWVVVDITKIGPTEEICPKRGQEHTVPLRRFQSWRDAEQYLLESGADTEVLQRTTTSLKQTGMAVLTIV